MNQREYSWEEEIIKFLYDIFKIYEEDKYVEKMDKNSDNGHSSLGSKSYVKKKII